MGVTDFLNTLSASQQAAPLVTPANANNNPTANKYGATLANSLTADKASTAQGFAQQKATDSVTVAAQYNNIASGAKNLNRFSVAQQTPLSQSGYQNQGIQSLGTINQYGQSALDTAIAKSQYQKQQQAINNAAGYTVNYVAPGASANNPGSQAVAAAMQAYNNKTPYVWSGNSLTKGVDCSGLVQQAYASLGIKLPRTTYEQAKAGQIISGGIQHAMPGDLIFYNTGSKDPNGIGTLSHVAIYLGNGKVLEAENSRVGITIDDVNYNGAPARIVRPWS